MKIHFESLDCPRVYRELTQHDLTNSDDSTTGIPDDTLNDNEIDQAGGFKELMRMLSGYGAGVISKGQSDDEYDVVIVDKRFCEEAPMVEVAKSSISKTPNGKVFPGVIVNIPGGEFEMGSTNGDNDEHKSDGTTVKVRMSGFRLAKTETTVGQYKAYLAATGDSTFSKLPDYDENKKGDDYPVVGLSFLEKDAFCKYYGGTLPTAAQTEYASKGPTHNDIYGTPMDKAIVWDNGARTTAEVCGTKDERANGFGVCDLAGNVWETTSDEYKSDSYDHASLVDPSNPYKDSGWLEYRGGSFSNDLRRARAADRVNDYPDRDSNVGFRCSWPQDSQNKKVIL